MGDKKMRAAVVRGNCDVAIMQVDEPEISAPSEIKIKVISGAICNTTDNKIYATDTPEKDWPNYKFPFIIGHECTGRITELGADVKNFKIGDRVVYWTTRGKAFADYLILDTVKSAVHAINDSVSNDVAAMMEMVIGSARMLFSAEGVPSINKDSNVVIFGLGPAGLIYHRTAKMMGAAKVIGVGRREFRLKKSLEMGADAAFSSDEAGYIEKVISFLGKKPNVIIDATGGDVVKDMIALGAKNTLIIRYGVPPFDWKTREHELTDAGLLLPGPRGVPSARIAAQKCVQWAESGKFGLEKIISHKLPFDQVGRGLDMCRLERDTTSKVIISINE
ncbi:MAG: alcohol dehydrogenase catalytic domain-containing protein [Treponema sp.]|nr:alcohol dehydrogenase catalytic domain-containing protein [Treponema sp.]